MTHLGINIDHVATLRQVRGGLEPNLAQAALEAQAGGAESITVHLREDRRHIQDADLPALRKVCRVPINLEMSLVPEIVRIALKFSPEKVCIVPERRQELTTEGGLDVVLRQASLRKVIPRFRKKKIEVSLFIAPSRRQIKMAALLGADAVEIHTGAYANACGRALHRELKKIQDAAAFAKRLGLKVHAGHGLDYRNTQAIASISEVEELNIGHAIISHAVSHGLRKSVAAMKKLIQTSRRSKR